MATAHLGKGSKLSQSNRVSLGIAISHALLQPGHSRSLGEIAAFCGCHRNSIYHIEQKALRKLRNRLQFVKDPVLRETIAHLISK